MFRPLTPRPGSIKTSGKKVWRWLPMQRCLAQTQQLMQVIPVEARAGVCLAARCNVGVASDAHAGGMGLLNDPTELGQPLKLNRLIGQCIAALQFHANRKIVAATAAHERGHAGMPGPIVTRDILNHQAVASNQKVGRDPQALQGGKARVRSAVEPPQEEVRDVVALETTLGQADAMHHDQVEAGPKRPRIGVWRWRVDEAWCRANPAVCPQGIKGLHGPSRNTARPGARPRHPMAGEGRTACRRPRTPGEAPALAGAGRASFCQAQGAA